MLGDGSPDAPPAWDVWLLDDYEEYDTGLVLSGDLEDVLKIAGREVYKMEVPDWSEKGKGFSITVHGVPEHFLLEAMNQIQRTYGGTWEVAELED